MCSPSGKTGQKEALPWWLIPLGVSMSVFSEKHRKQKRYSHQNVASAAGDGPRNLA